MDTTISKLRFIPDANGDSRYDECDVSFAIGVDNPASETGKKGCSPFRIDEPVLATVWAGHLLQFQAAGVTYVNYFPGSLSPQLIVTLIILVAGTGLGLLGWPVLARWRTPKASRLVIRPGLVASIFNGLIASLLLLFGVWTTSTGPKALGPGVVAATVGALFILYLISASVEADATQVTKRYIFGLSRTIPIQDLTVIRSREYNNWSSYQVINFCRGNQPVFAIIPFYVWRIKDADRLLDSLPSAHAIDASLGKNIWWNVRTIAIILASIAGCIAVAVAINYFA